MKKLVLILSIIIGCAITINDVIAEDVKLEIKKSGGKTIKDKNTGRYYVGYGKTEKYDNILNGKRHIRIVCTDKGQEYCPDAHIVYSGEIYPLTEEIYFQLEDKIKQSIDMGIDHGRIYHQAEIYCVWNEGSKTFDEEGCNYVYNYNLMIFLGNEEHVLPIVPRKKLN